ncbi:DNA mismatch repair protein MutS, partial [Chloroflexota bacterium]
MTTPIRRQYLKIKRSYPQAIVFFRLGDFYETFDEDARLVSRELQITLTSREMGQGQRFPMAGIPYHALDNYLARLVGRGHKVAICEQMSEPGAQKGLVEREVVRVVTPGTVVEPNMLEGKSNNFLASVIAEGEEVGVAYVDITTSEFATSQFPAAHLPAELSRLDPSELLVSQDGLIPDMPCAETRIDYQWFDLEVAREMLLEHFGASSLEGYGCAHQPLAIRAAGVVLYYLGQTQKGVLGQLARLSTYSTGSFMTLDTQTRRNLELFQSSRWGMTSGSLISIIDLTRTAMGGRLLKKWLGQPPLDINALNMRQDAVEWFYSNSVSRAATMSLLAKLGDLERLTNRARSGIADPRDLVSLKQSLELVPGLKEEISGADSLSWLWGELKTCEEAVAVIASAIADNPPLSVGEGGVIRQGFSAELDELRSASSNAKEYLADLERVERERTGIKSLKVGYNRVFGYYIEVTSSHLPRVPADYIRKQTLAGGERFFTPQLKEYESQILNADERAAELESTIFSQVCQQVAGWGEHIMGTAAVLAQIDVLAGFAEAAARYGYVRPELTTGDEIAISEGRHPVVERVLSDAGFVPNDTQLSNGGSQLIVLTGPNMAGKSTYLRQVAIIVLLAQIGSFVPAASATICLVDRIFTRVGLLDDLASGQSTFMIEMMETANILNNATPRSLIILDEIGRGTSTYDGLSIARAVAEYIHNHPRLGAKTLFATHYHELVELAGLLPRVKNYNVAVSEEGGKVVF